MKTKIIQIGCLLLLLMAAASCKKALEDTLSRDIPINNRTITFTVKPGTKSAEAVATRAGEAENVLFDGVLEINIAAELEKQGFSFKNIKSFILKQGTLELVTPKGFDMNGFKDAKLYFDNMDKLVARADKVDGSTVRFSIVNGELLDQLTEDKLHIILTGQLPSMEVTLKLVMDYVAKISLIK